MAGRTFVIGDVHGDIRALRDLWGMLPPLDAKDTVVFLGDYVDRGPDSAGVVEFVRIEVPSRCAAHIVALRGNHEDAWLRAIDEGFAGFTEPPQNGALACLRSYAGGPAPRRGESPTAAEAELLPRGQFYPAEVVSWMRALPFWYEDEHAIYVHAGVPWNGERWLHPREAEPATPLLWLRTRAFFTDYRGKTIVVGHTTTGMLPPELSNFTPEDPTDLWAGPCVYALDTGAGKGGFLTALELPALHVYESRRAAQ
jgi:serine/threonine protein phosphatase 1